jgi:hypothetical protein
MFDFPFLSSDILFFPNFLVTPSQETPGFHLLMKNKKNETYSLRYTKHSEQSKTKERAVAGLPFLYPLVSLI